MPNPFNRGDHFLENTVVMTVAILLAAWLLPGVQVNGVGAALLAAVVIAALNSFVRPLLVFLSLPYAVASMGLVLLLINGFVIWMADGLLGSALELKNFGTCILLSIIIIVVDYLITYLSRLLSRREYHDDTSPYHKGRHDDDGFDSYEEVE